MGDGIFTAFDVSGSALRAERLRMNLIANNLANMTTTRVNGRRATPYRRKQAVFALGAPDMTGDAELGVRLERVALDTAPFRRVFRPDHPDAITDADIANSGGRLASEDN